MTPHSRTSKGPDIPYQGLFYCIAHSLLARAIVRRLVAAGALGLTVRTAAGMAVIMLISLRAAQRALPSVCRCAAGGASKFIHRMN